MCVIDQDETWSKRRNPAALMAESQGIPRARSGVVFSVCCCWPFSLMSAGSGDQGEQPCHREQMS